MGFWSSVWGKAVTILGIGTLLGSPGTQAVSGALRGTNTDAQGTAGSDAVQPPLDFGVPAKDLTPNQMFLEESFIEEPNKLIATLPAETLARTKDQYIATDKQHARDLVEVTADWTCLYNRYSSAVHDTITVRQSLEFEITNVVGTDVATENPCLKLAFATDAGSVVHIAIGKCTTDDLADTIGNLDFPLQKFTTIQVLFTTDKTVAIKAINTDGTKSNTEITLASGKFNGQVSPYSPRFSAPAIFHIKKDGVIIEATPGATQSPTTFSGTGNTGNSTSNTTIIDDEGITKKTGALPTRDEPTKESNASAFLAGAAVTAVVAGSAYGAKKYRDSKIRDQAAPTTPATTASTSATSSRSTTTPFKGNTIAAKPVALSQGQGGSQLAQPTRTVVQERTQTLHSQTKSSAPVPTGTKRTTINHPTKQTGKFVASTTASSGTSITGVNVRELREKFERSGKKSDPKA